MKAVIEKKYMLIVGALLSYMLLFYAPLEVYLTNKGEMWFKLSDVIGLFVLLAVVAFLFYSFIFIVLPSKIAQMAAIIAAGIAFILYVQGTYIPCNYGVLNGVEVQWEQYRSYGYISIAIVAAVFIILGILVKWKGCKFLLKYVAYVCLFIMLIQTISIIILGIQSADYSGKNESITVTDDNLMNYSDDKNIVVLVVDSYDSSMFSAALEENEEVADILKDYTYYPDTLGAFPTTQGALPQILTGIWYENQDKYDDYIERAFESTKLYDLLKEEGYESNVYTNAKYLSKDTQNIFENVCAGEYTISQPLKLTEKMIQLACYKYFPHQLKKYFWMYTGDLDEYKELDLNGKSAWKTGANNTYLYEKIDDELVADKQLKQFKLYHIVGMHQPYSIDENAQQADNPTVQQTALGCVEIMNRLNEELKENNIYDNTAVIILADHGSYELGQNPLLLIKYFNSEQEKMKISEDAVSYDALQDVMSAIAKEDEQSYIESLKQYNGKERRFLRYQWEAEAWDKDYFPEMVEYYCKEEENAGDVTNLYKSGSIYKDGTLIETEESVYTYSEGEQIIFDNDDIIHQLFVSGVSNVEETEYGHKVWSCAKSSELKIDLSGQTSKQDLKIEMVCGAYDDSQTMEVYCNSHYVGRAQGNEKGMYIIIPRNYLTDDVQDIELEYPNAVRPSEQGVSNDNRTLAYAFEKMEFSMGDYVYQLEDNDEIHFDENQKVFYEGLSEPEVSGGISRMWSAQPESYLRIGIGTEKPKNELKISISAYPFDENQYIKVYVEEEFLCDAYPEGENKDYIEISIPASKIPDDILKIRFEYPNAVCPLDEGTGTDGRTLSFYYDVMRLEID